MPAIVLLICVLLLAGANLWFTAARSLIPVAVAARCISNEQRPEKHPGTDDVYLLKLEGGRTLQVDRTIHEFAEEGSELYKTAWSQQLQCGSQSLRLTLSRDFWGMAWVMPATIIAAVVLCAISLRNF